MTEPFNGEPADIEERIEAEDFDHGEQNEAYYQVNLENDYDTDYRDDPVDIRDESVESGWVIGKFLEGEWLAYTVTASPGTYNLFARTGTTKDNRQLEFGVGGEVVGVVNVENTGSWHDFKTMKLENVRVNADGETDVKMRAVNGGVDIDWFRFEKRGQVHSTDFSEYATQ